MTDIVTPDDDYDDHDLVSEDDCPSGMCNEYEECGSCDGTGQDPYGYGTCHGCDGAGEIVPEHCCVCGGSPYCLCCRQCGGDYVGDCHCPIPTDRDANPVVSS